MLWRHNALLIELMAIKRTPQLENHSSMHHHIMLNRIKSFLEFPDAQRFINAFFARKWAPTSHH